MSIGDVDVYGEVAWKQHLDIPGRARSPQHAHRRDRAGSPHSAGHDGHREHPASVTVPLRSTPVIQAAGGVTYSINFEGNKSITLGAEYFYNSASYTRDEYLPLLILGGFQPFYVGKHYLALSATLLETAQKRTWILSGIGNLSDGSYIARLDFVITVLSYLSVESYDRRPFRPHRGGAAARLSAHHAAARRCHRAAAGGQPCVRPTERSHPRPGRGLRLSI
jgi:hypothetical protein